MRRVCSFRGTTLREGLDHFWRVQDGVYLEEYCKRWDLEHLGLIYDEKVEDLNERNMRPLRGSKRGPFGNIVVEFKFTRRAYVT